LLLLPYGQLLAIIVPDTRTTTAAATTFIAGRWFWFFDHFYCHDWRFTSVHGMLLCRYFSGIEVLMSSAYYPQIWQTILQIPPGKVASYGQIADLSGLPGRARLVGKALGMAPPSMGLPWHRVLRSNLTLAFAAGSPQALLQRGLLLAEGVIFQGQRVAKTTQWQPDLAELLFALKY
jgi:methylated-DNA-protein-cysteine methyltransferase related protein